MSNSTRREAERIVGAQLDSKDARFKPLVIAIAQALQARDERAAKIAEQRWALMSSFGTTETDHYTRACYEIAAAIRKDD